MESLENQMARLGEVTFTLYRDKKNIDKHGETSRDFPKLLCSEDYVTVNCGSCSRYRFEADTWIFTSDEKIPLKDLIKKKALAFQYTDKNDCLQHQLIDKNSLVSFAPSGPYKLVQIIGQNR